MVHSQCHFAEGKCLELRVSDVEDNCVRVYVPGRFICQFSENEWTFLTKCYQSVLKLGLMIL